MATIEFTLSSKNNRITQEHEILMRFFHGRRINQRAKTKIYIKADYWQPSVIYNDKRKVASPARISDIERPILPRLRTPEKMQQYNEQLELLETLKDKQKQLDDIEKKVIESFRETDIESVANNSKWLQTIIDEMQPNKKTIKPNKTDEVSFFDKFDEYIEKNDVTYHRKQLYKVVKRLLMRYELFTNSKITFENLCSDTLFSFEEFAANEYTFCDSDSYRAILAQVEESRTPKPRGKNTIVDIMKILRAFIKWSEQCKDKDPFGGYQIGECIYNETPYYLTVEERNRLHEYDFSHNKQLETQRDIFVFQCLIGARVSDLWNFTKSNVIDDDAVEYIAQKTLGKNAVVTRVPLTETAKNILDKYKDYHGKTLFPFTSQQRYNIDIKKILQTVGIDRIVTTLNPTNRKYEQHPIYEVASSHIARRTFIGNIYKVVQDPNLISSMSGHKEGSKAFARYRAIDDDIKKSVLSKIE